MDKKIFIFSAVFFIVGLLLGGGGIWLIGKKGLDDLKNNLTEARDSIKRGQQDNNRLKNELSGLNDLIKRNANQIKSSVDYTGQLDRGIKQAIDDNRTGQQIIDDMLKRE